MEKINIHESYDSFVGHFKIYLTKKKAQAKGYEAHHIIPQAVQERERGKVYDHRCIRVTRLQHTFAHYLYCKQYPEDREEFIALNCMLDMRAKEFLADEKKFLEELPDIAELVKIGRKVHSENMQGENNPNYGKHPSSEIRKKMSEKLKGKPAWNKGIPMSEEQKEHLSKVKKGKKHSEATRKKMSESHRRNGSPVARKVFQRDLEGNIIHIFSSVTEAITHFKLSNVTINKYLHGQTPKNLTYTLSYN